MKIANICPTPLLNDLLGPEETYHLVLTNQVLEDQPYRDFYSYLSSLGSHWIILDTNAYEQRGEVTSMDDLLAAALAIRPSEIVLPDKYDSSAKECVELAHQALRTFERVDLSFEPSFMAVPHGENTEEFLACVNTLCHLEGVTTIGLPKSMSLSLGLPRDIAITDIDSFFPNLRHINIHFLGK